MLTARLRERVPSAAPVGTGHLPGYVLKWHKRSRDGSGKCDIESTGRNEDIVWGVLFELDSTEKPALDRAEGLNYGYAEQQLDIVTDHGTVRAVAYIATKKDPVLRPYHWYKGFAVAGAREHRLPPEYIQSLKNAPSIPDPDAERAAQNERLLAAS